MPEDLEQLQNEVDRNYAAFQKKLPELESLAGKFALMRHGEIIQFYDTFLDAVVTGQRFYEDGLFSVQEVNAEPVDLGYYSIAACNN